MVPDFLLNETTVREAGEGAAFECGEALGHDLALTLGITHAVEHESIEVRVYGSTDGLSWEAEPLLTFPAKNYCGTYKLILPKLEQRYLKAAWTVRRWGRSDATPYFRIYVFARYGRAAAAGSA